METPLSPYPTLYLGLITTLFLFLLHKLLHNNNLNLPPGPKPYPILGNLTQMGTLPHRSIQQLSLKYGPIMQLQFGSVPVVVGSSIEMARIFLKTMDINFVGRHKTASGKYTTYNYSNVTWSPYGPYWRQARKIFVTELFSPKRLESYEFIRKEEMKSLMRRLYKSCGEEILLKDHVATLSMSVIGRMVLGKNYMHGLHGNESKSVVEPEEFQKMIEELFLLNGVLNVGDYVKGVGFLDLQGYVKRMKVVSKKLDRFLEIVLDEHEDRRRKGGLGNGESGENKVKDMVDVLLDLAQDPTLEVKLGRHGVKAFTLDLLAGGTESSATLVEWAISEVLKKPEIFKKATEELDRVIGQNRWIEENDAPNLPYIQAIMKETMRLHPVAPMLVPRAAREDCKVAGYDIRKGTIVLVNVWAIGRDPKVWDDPNEFNPDRFIGKKIDVKGHDFELLPFGSGRRMCPGNALGLKEVETSLANLLHGFNWRLPRDMTLEDLEMEETFGLSTPKRVPLIVIVEPRLPLELYSTL